MLRLAGVDDGPVVCPECAGKGRVPCPEVQAVRTGLSGMNVQGGAVMAPGGGCPIPCPRCKGKKIIASATPGQAGNNG